MLHKKDYYGFVYKWYDRKRNMWYIGSHHGDVDSGYVCSNAQMLNAYKKRPGDFTRIILEYNTIDDNHAITKQLEQKFLDLVPDIKNNSNYYNIKTEAQGGWSFINEEHIDKRASSLKIKHQEHGLTEKEKTSYKKKIQSRLNRIAEKGFTKKEIDQHNAYGYKINVILPNGEEKVYPSLAKASKDLKIDCQYARLVTLQNRTYKGYQVIVLSEPKIDCRGFKK